MRRTQAVLGSIAVHAVVAVALLTMQRAGDPRAPASRSTIEMIDAAPVELVDLELAPEAARTATPGGASGGSPVQVATAKARTRRSPTQVDPRGTIAFERDGERDDGGDDGRDSGAAAAGGCAGAGDCVGGGRGRGRGIGFGDGGGLPIPPAAPTPPPAPSGDPPSKARPATLIFPVRQRDVDDAELFIARVTIDHEGFVVGAKLVRGFGGPRDEQASDLIWRFRYAPALDAAGRPIRSTLDQRFLVGP